jgi:hypothetical protein
MNVLRSADYEGKQDFKSWSRITRLAPMGTILLLVAAAAAAFAASVIMSRAANRPALWNMGLGGALASVVLVCAVAIAYGITRSMLPPPSSAGGERDRQQTIVVKVLVLSFDPRIAEAAIRVHGFQLRARRRRDAR